MKRKFRVLSILSAVIMGATMCLTACNNSSEVAEHDHVWNSGETTTEPTCQTEGVKTYTCTVEGCTQKKTEPVGKNPHIWDGGSETKAPKCNEEGEKTYKCTNEGCTATKTEPIEKTAHSWAGVGTVKLAPDFYTKGIMEYGCQNEGCTATKEESIHAGADFNYQFSEEAGGEWSYGSTAEFDGATGAFEFTPAEYDSENKAWKADGIEITKGAVNIPGGKTAVISYTFKTEVREKIEAFAEISFMDGVKAYLVSTVGGDKSVEELNGGKFTSDNVAVQKGDQFALVLKNEGTSAVAGGLSFTVEADCVHVWSDKGTEKTSATCTTMGTTTYECINCGETIDRVDIPMTGHKIESAFTAPTLTQEGKLHYECSVCHDEATKRDETLPKQANFAYDFTTEAGGKWVYGYATDYNWDTNGFTFHNDLTANAGEGQWNTSDNKIKIKSDYFESDDGKDVTVGYKVRPGETAKSIVVKFNGSDNPEAQPRYAIRVIVNGESGNVKTCKIDDSGENLATWTYTANDINAEAGDTIYVVFFHKGGWQQGKFELQILPEAVQQPEPAEQEIANFEKDFGNEDVWLYGYSTDYHFDTNAFTFNSLTADGDGNYTSIDGENKLEIKKDFVCSEYGGRDLAIGYKVPAGQSKLKVKVDFAGSNEATQIAPRILVVRDNATQSAQFFGECESKQNWSITHEVDVAGGDIIYVILFPKADTGYKHGKLQITIDGEKAQQPSTSTVVSDFQKEFHDNTVTESNWEYGSADYGWDGNHAIKANKDNTESFTYTKSETYDSANNAWTADGVEIKADWIKFEKNAVILYKAPAGGEADFHITFKGEENKNTWSAVRIIITDGNNNFKDREEIWDGKNNSQYDKMFSKTLAAGYKVYFIFFSEGTNGSGVATDNKYGHLTLTVTYKAA